MNVPHVVGSAAMVLRRDHDETGPAFERIVAEYRAMPGSSLTAAQAGRLFALAPDQCVTALRALVAQGRLRRRADGRYCAAGDLLAGRA